jgi:hypothetical protein
VDVAARRQRSSPARLWLARQQGEACLPAVQSEQLRQPEQCSLEAEPPGAVRQRWQARNPHYCSEPEAEQKPRLPISRQAGMLVVSPGQPV